MFASTVKAVWDMSEFDIEAVWQAVDQRTALHLARVQRASPCSVVSAGGPARPTVGASVHKSRIPHRGEDVGLDFAAHWSRPKLLPDCGCRNVRRFRQPIRIMSLDLIPHRCALAVSNRN